MFGWRANVQRQSTKIKIGQKKSGNDVFDSTELSDGNFFGLSRRDDKDRKKEREKSLFLWPPQRCTVDSHAISLLTRALHSNKNMILKLGMKWYFFFYHSMYSEIGHFEEMQKNS